MWLRSGGEWPVCLEIGATSRVGGGNGGGSLAIVNREQEPRGFSVYEHTAWPGAPEIYHNARAVNRAGEGRAASMKNTTRCGK